jgi:lysozyme family protein
LFDLAVNTGILQANKLIQRALRSTGVSVTEDGIIGPVTLAALKSEAAGYYRLIANINPSQLTFINGWLRRAYS